jgi:hypothetical protein
VAELLQRRRRAIPLQRRERPQTNNSSKLVVVRDPGAQRHIARPGLPIVAKLLLQNGGSKRTAVIFDPCDVGKGVHGHVSLFAVDPPRCPKTDILGKRLPWR